MKIRHTGSLRKPDPLTKASLTSPTVTYPATKVGAGIVVTRLLGLLRERLFAQYFGNGATADAFRAALRIPNVIRNLLGEGTLSASFIPAFAGLIARGDEEGARKLSSVIASLLIVLASLSALAGIVLAPLIVTAVAPGFTEETKALTVALIEIMFPMSGLLVLSAWCLAVLNTHRRFFLSYSAPAMWNIAQIATLVVLGGSLLGTRLVVALAWGALAGALLQLVVQLPATFKLVGVPRWSLDLMNPEARKVIRAWIPIVVGTGVLQLSSVIDTQLGSLVGQGAVAMLGYAQLLAILPISLFGISVAASSLPELARDVAGADRDALRTRIADGGRQISYFAIPSAFLFASIGWLVIALLFQTGRFGSEDTALVAGVLAAYSIGLPGQAVVKLLASGHYAMGDTRTPVKIAAMSLVLSTGLAILLMRYFGAAGIALGSSIGIYLNVALNGRALSSKIGSFTDRPSFRTLSVTFAGALVATAAGLLAADLLQFQTLWLRALAALGTFGLIYLLATAALKHPEAQQIMKVITRLG